MTATELISILSTAELLKLRANASDAVVIAAIDSALGAENDD